jgi:hypothetical protein
VPHVPAPYSITGIEGEVVDQIKPGAGGRLIVPQVSLDADLDEGAELDLASLQAKRIRRPGRREWIWLDMSLELPTRLLLHKSRPDSIETDYYCVEEPLLDRIQDELKNVRVFPYYSVSAQAIALWIINVTPGNSWYESLVPLFRKPPEFFASHVIRVASDRANGRYRVYIKPAERKVTWPTTETGALLGEALGPRHFILSAEHPIYRELIEGTELP